MASSSTAATCGLRGRVTTELDALGVRDDAVVDYVTGIATEVGRVHRRDQPLYALTDSRGVRLLELRRRTRMWTTSRRVWASS